MRPNSPPQITSVSSSSPRRLRSVEQCRNRPIDLSALLGQVFDDVVAGAGAVTVPSPVEELNVAHPSLEQPAGQQAVIREGRRPGLGAVFFQDFLGLLADIHRVGDGHLHPECQLVLADPRHGLGVAELGKLVFVELPRSASSVRRRSARSMPLGSLT